ncbi:hypothetical protein predicted by Glimmer/Critica [Salmonella enterica subsp. enterica serovar Weltevreden str. 2007-60-3289-1]|nr:hypothetical protein predicted by Glimmer/Critica [Salmonella enterica subsp. enterica serovar Weltevreden str. 2007-60-3289-1]
MYYYFYMTFKDILSRWKPKKIGIRDLDPDSACSSLA